MAGLHDGAAAVGALGLAVEELGLGGQLAGPLHEVLQLLAALQHAICEKRRVNCTVVSTSGSGVVCRMIKTSRRSS